MLISSHLKTPIILLQNMIRVLGVQSMETNKTFPVVYQINTEYRKDK